MAINLYEIYHETFEDYEACLTGKKIMLGAYVPQPTGKLDVFEKYRFASIFIDQPEDINRENIRRRIDLESKHPNFIGQIVIEKVSNLTIAQNYCDLLDSIR